MSYWPTRSWRADYAPSTDQDATVGFRDGDVWLDVVLGDAYYCSDAATGAWTAWPGGGGGGGGAPTGAQYITLATNGTLTAERVLTLTSGQLSGVDAGAGSAYTISIADNPTLPGTAGAIVPTGTTAQRGTATAGKIRYSTTFSAVEWCDGSSWYQVPTSGAPTGAQYLTLATDGTLTAERVLTLTSGQLAGVDAGAGSTYTISLASDAALPGNAGITLPVGTTGQRGAAAAGKIRGNSTLGVVEWSDGTNWYPFLTAITPGTLIDIPVTGSTITIDVDLTEAASVTPAIGDEAVLIQSAAPGKATLRTVDREVRRNRYPRGLHLYEDFLTDAATTTAGNGRGIETNDTGASTTTSAISEVGHPGQVTSTTGTSATSGATFQAAGSQSIRFGGGTWVYEIELKIPTLSDSSQRYALLVGFFDVVNVANQVDGAYFLYDEGGVSTGSAASANWQIVTAASSGRSFQTSSTAVGTGWTTLRIEVNADATSVEYFVNGVSIGTRTASIPTSAAQLTGAGWCIKKSVGTTARTVVVDYVLVDAEFSADRAA